MNTLVHADVFFFIASIGFILIFAIAIVGGVFVVGILKNVNRISAKLDADVDSISADAKAFIVDLRRSMVYRLLFGRPSKKTAEKK